jgi:hypothetical protein
MTSANTAAANHHRRPDWLCHPCGFNSPPGDDCLTCETLPMIGDRE